MKFKMNRIPPKNDEYPWLVYPREDEQILSLPLHYGLKSNYIFSIPESVPALRGRSTRILSTSSFNGFHYHLICNHPSHLIIWNQKTNYTLVLPPLPENYSCFRESTLWITPVLSTGFANGFVILFHASQQTITFCNIYYLNPNDDFQAGASWSVMRYTTMMREIFGDDDEGGIIDQPVCYNEHVCAVYSYYHLILIKVDSNRDLFIQPTDCRIPHFHGLGVTAYFHLIQSLGELISIFISFRANGRILGVEMYKLNWDSKSWNMLLSDDKYFFLNAQNSFSCLADGVGRIFVFKFKDIVLHSIDLRDASVKSFLPYPIPSKPWESPYWVPADNDVAGLDSFYFIVPYESPYWVPVDYDVLGLDDFNFTISYESPYLVPADYDVAGLDSIISNEEDSEDY